MKTLTLILTILIVVAVSSTSQASVLGYQTAGSINRSLENFIQGTAFKMSTTGGIAESVTVYLDFTDLAGSTYTVRTGIFIWRGTSVACDLIDTSAEVSFPVSSTSDGWKSFALLQEAYLYPDSTYLVCAVANSTGDVLNTKLTGGRTGDTAAYKSITYSTQWVSSQFFTSIRSDSAISIYATFSPDVAEGTNEDGCTTCDSLNAPTRAIGGAQRSIENNIVMTLDTLPSGGDKTAEGILIYLSATTGGANSASNIKCLLYERNGASWVLKGTTDQRSLNIETAGAGWYYFTFSGTKPTLKGDSLYHFGGWGANNANTTLSMRLNTAGTHNYSQDAETYGTSPDPSGLSVTDATAYVSTILYYSTPSAGGTLKPRRRDIILKSIGLVQDAIQCFAGGVDEVPR